jgi:hypothetical protein
VLRKRRQALVIAAICPSITVVHLCSNGCTASLLPQALNEEQKQLLSTKDTVERSVVEHTAILALLEEVAATESAIAVAKAAEEAEAAARVVSH